MAQHKIERAYFALWDKEISVHDYDAFERSYAFYHSFRDLRCVYCDDPIEFVRRDGGYFFKHNPHGDGHEFCRLYSGHKDPTPEFNLKRATAHDKDIGLVFNMVYDDGKWKASIMIPPFTQNAISMHQANHTAIHITHDNSYVTTTLPVNFEQFSPGELRRVDLPTIPRAIHIRFSGKAPASKANNLELEGFVSDRMLFRTSIPDMFTETVHGSGLIDLTPMKRLSLRRVSHVIYTEKPYIFFYDTRYGKYHLPMKKEQAELKKLLFKKDRFFDFDVYQIVFHKVDSETARFCERRGCLLEERSDAVVLWPPVIISGENHFLDARSSSVFFSLENDRKTFDLVTVTAPRDFLRVSNLNTLPFYVMRRDEIDSQKPYGKPSDEIQTELDCSHGNFYRFLNGALLGPETERRHKLIPGESIVHIASRLAPRTYTSGKVQTIRKSTISILLRDAIDSPSDYVFFSKAQHTRLREKYSSDPYVMDYLDYCLYQNEINEAALHVLIGGM